MDGAKDSFRAGEWIYSGICIGSINPVLSEFSPSIPGHNSKPCEPAIRPFSDSRFHVLNPAAPTQPQESTGTQPLRDSHLRSILKAVSWRLLGTADTILISYFWTGQGSKALAIGGSEVLTKVGLYYVHERVWASIPLGTLRALNPLHNEEGQDPILRDSKFRSVIKAISWRILGTLDTLAVSYFWTQDTGKALVISSTDVLTKLALYYVHERAWARIPLGTLRKKWLSDSVDA
jgi:uncharacterized membrane protein